MGYRRRQNNVSHSFAPHGRFSDINATFIAFNALIADFLIFAAITFVIFSRPKNSL